MSATLRRRGIAALALFALAPLPAAAQSPACGGVKSQPEINACELRLYEKSDAELNRLYRQLRATADGRALQALEAAERAWIAYRDRECTFETIGEEGGSIRPMEEAICSRKMTAARAAELKRLLACQKDAGGCP